MKNSSLKIKMALLLGVPIGVLSVLLIISMLTDKRMSDHLITVLYDETFVASSHLIEADRDMYQAARELTVMGNSENDAQFDEAFHSFEENIAQVKERVQIEREALQSDPVFNTAAHEQTGLTMSENFSQFDQHFAE